MKNLFTLFFVLALFVAGAFNTQYFADPQESIIGILMKQTQRTTSDETAWKFRLLVGQAVDD